MNPNDFASSSSSSNSKPRQRRSARAEIESLEGRAMLTGGLGNNFALATGHIANAGDVSTLSISVNPSQFKAPRGSVVIGVDVADQKGSELKPRIAVVNDSQGKALPSAAANPSTLHASLVRVKINPRVKAPKQEVKVVGGDEKAVGDYVAGFYLPGDANGDGAVTANDISVVRAIQGVKSTQENYIFDADADRNGTIDQQDLKIAQQNLGVRTTVVPVISADLSPQSDSGKVDRITNVRKVTFTGMASPGTKITYSEESNKTAPVSTVVNNKGTYQIQLALADGENLPNVQAVDPFGQTFSGKLAAVTYDPNAPTETTTPAAAAAANSAASTTMTDTATTPAASTTTTTTDPNATAGVNASE